MSTHRYSSSAKNCRFHRIDILVWNFACFVRLRDVLYCLQNRFRLSLLNCCVLCCLLLYIFIKRRRQSHPPNGVQPQLNRVCLPILFAFFLFAYLFQYPGFFDWSIRLKNRRNYFLSANFLLAKMTVKKMSLQWLYILISS